MSLRKFILILKLEDQKPGTDPTNPKSKQCADPLPQENSPNQECQKPTVAQIKKNANYSQADPNSLQLLRNRKYRKRGGASPSRRDRM